MRSLFAGFLFLFAANLQAQDNGHLLINIQQKTAPKFHLIKTHNGITPLEVKLSLYHLETSPVEISGFLSWGYPSSIDLSYGLSAAYLFLVKDNYWLKTGLYIGRFKMGSFKDTVELGAILEDQFHESFKPYVELQWDFSKYAGLFVQAGYRFLRTETERVTEVLSRYENGDIKAYRTSSNTNFYGSGFELGIGLSVILY